MTVDLSEQTWAITGAAGRIGTTLRAGLRGSVASLVLIDSRPVADPQPGELVVVLDIADAVAVREALAGKNIAGVIHLAAIPDEADFRDLVQANIVGTWHVLEAIREAGIPRIVYASTGRTIGMYDAGTIVSSDDPTRPDGLYAVSKVAGEALCRMYVDKFGLRATCMRIGAFKDEPVEARDLSVWLSPADAVRAFVAAMAQESEAFAVLLTYSANTHGWADLAPGRALGFDPVDDASDHREAAGLADQPVTTGVAAGVLGSPEFTLGRQRGF